MAKKLPKSVKKYIRRQKAQLRRRISDPKKVEAEIRSLLETFRGQK